MIVRTRFWLDRVRECGELQYVTRFSLRRKKRCLQLLFKTSNSLWESCMFPEGK